MRNNKRKSVQATAAQRRANTIASMLSASMCLLKHTAFRQ